MLFFFSAVFMTGSISFLLLLLQITKTTMTENDTNVLA
jgi:hypothetical protein